MKFNGDGHFNKIKHFSHSDLDGIGCIVVTKSVFGDMIDAETIDANKSSEIINDWLDSKFDPAIYSGIFITDISVSVEVAAKIQRLSEQYNLCITLQDHHGTAIDLNQFSWCRVIEDKDHCGTNMIHETLKSWYCAENGCWNPTFMTELDLLNDFVLEVHNYDNWIWVDIDDQLANDLNNLLKILGKERFLDRFVEDHSIALSDSEHALLILENEKIDRHVFTHTLSSVVNKIRLQVPNGPSYNCVATFTDGYNNECCHKLLEQNPDVDVAIAINLSFVISFRARDGIDLVPLTTFLGGGGHPVSGGAPINNDIRISALKLIFDNVGVEFI